MTRWLAVATLLATLAGCYPTFDWRDFRPDCGKYWCDFTVSMPGRVTSASRDIPLDGKPVPLSLHVITVKDLTFAVGVFDLTGGASAVSARAAFERKLLEDVNATEGRKGEATVRARDRTELPAETFEASGERQGHALRAMARFVERRGRLIEILVIGSAPAMQTASGAQALDTYFTSLRID